MISFEWDPRKDLSNQRKHGISFDEAKTVFDDVEAIAFDDPEHSSDEERLLIIGLSNKGNLCIVSHCYRGDFIIRIISARKANSQETVVYKKYSGVMS